MSQAPTPGYATKEIQAYLLQCGVEGGGDAGERRDGDLVAVDGGDEVVSGLHHLVQGALEVLDDAPLLTAHHPISFPESVQRPTSGK